jgi:LacI family transcriptional regulator
MRRGSWQGPTVASIAAAAGVSNSTVDRVLHGRSGVSRRNVDAVLQACARLNIELPEGNLIGSAPVVARGPALRVTVVSDSGGTLNARLEKAAARYAAGDESIRLSVYTQTTVEFDPDRFSEKIANAAKNSDGLILISRDHAAVRRAINHAVAGGTAVICVTTDVPESARAAYVGMDQLGAGSCGAYLMGRFAGNRMGRVVLVASAPYRCQEEREIGFRRVLRTEFPNLQVEESINSNDDAEFSYRNMLEILVGDRVPVGVYNVAGGNPGIARAIAERGLTGEIIFIGHEANEASMELLDTGAMDAVLAHDIDAEIARAIEAIRILRTGGDPGAIPQARTRPIIILKYNH